MFVLLYVITILLIVAGWYLITRAARDVFATVRLAATVGPKNGSQRTYYYSLSCLVMGRAYRTIRCRAGLRIFASFARVLFPVLQFLFWKASFIAGFAFLYLAVNLKLKGERFADKISEDFFSALWLSFTISLRLAPYNLNSDEMLIFLIANFQFYLGFLFYGFVCFYLLTLRRKAGRLQPFLFGLENELENPYSPFRFAANLKELCGTREIILILRNWELWAEKLTNDLISCPSLIYSRSFTKSRTWLASLNIILDASAALIVTSDVTFDAAVECQARRTFAAARRALLEIAEYLRVSPPDSKPTLSGRETPVNCEDEILSADIIFEASSSDSTANEIEMLSVWQLTCQSSLTALADYLDVELPSRKHKKSQLTVKS